MARRVAPRSSAAGDRISQLPVEILDRIMGLLPIQQAAQTAVLSKVLRDVWSTLTQLCFDHQFFRYLHRKHQKEGKYFKLSSCLYAVNKVLLLHKGPIKKFVFLFPGDCTVIVRSRSYDMNQWLLLVTQQGVEEIHLRFGDRHYKLPECLFSSSTLKILHLSGFCIEPRKSPCTLPNLTSLCFDQAKFVPRNTTNYAIDVPKLQNLSFIDCEDTSHFNIIARNLSSLKITCYSSEGGSFLPTNFDWSSIRTLDLVDSSHRCLLGDHTSNGLPLQLPALNVESLRLSGVCFKTDAATPAFVCLLRKCPKLCKLEISFVCLGDKCLDATLEHLEKVRSVARTHKNLSSLKFSSFNGSRSKMHFIKEMLACLPALEEVIIGTSYMFDWNKKCDILEEISHFPCASAKAKIAYR